MTTKCNMGPWIGSGPEKKIFGKNWQNSNKVCILVNNMVSLLVSWFYFTLNYVYRRWSHLGSWVKSTQEFSVLFTQLFCKSMLFFFYVKKKKLGRSQISEFASAKIIQVFRENAFNVCQG